MTLDGWFIFVAVWIAASVPLGPNALNCISTSAAFGARRGLWSAVGVTLAAVLHMTLSVTGLAAFLAAHSVVFEAIRWAGVAYLVWMGIALLRSHGTVKPVARIDSARRRRLVMRAVLISLGNPKSIFVWMAVFSQFIDPVQPLSGQLTVLAPTALAITFVVYAGYVLLGSGAGRFFNSKRKLWFDRFTGATFLAFAAGLANADLRRV